MTFQLFLFYFQYMLLIEFLTFNNKFQLLQLIINKTVYINLKQNISMSLVRHCSPSRSTEYSDVNSNEGSSILQNQKGNSPIKKESQKLVSLIGIAQLQKNIESQFIRNKISLSKIQKYDSTFSYNLYTPSALQKIRTVGFQATQQLLLKQLDKLLEQDSILQKNIRKLEMLDKRQSQLKYDIEVQSSHNYLFLRNIWKQKLYKGCLFKNSEEQLQNLNVQVAMIKNNIFKRIEAQKYQIQQNEKKQIQQAILQTKTYKKLQQKYNKLLREQQQLLLKLSQKTCKNPQNQILISKFQNQNEIYLQNLNLKQQARILKNKLKQNEKKQYDLHKKINQLLNQKKFQIKKSIQKVIVQVKHIDNHLDKQYLPGNEELKLKNEEKMDYNYIKTLQIANINIGGQIIQIKSKKSLNSLINYLKINEQNLNQSYFVEQIVEKVKSVEKPLKFLSIRKKIEEHNILPQKQIKNTSKFIRLQSPLKGQVFQKP